MTKTEMIKARKSALLKYLIVNFVAGKWFTIEEICNNVCYVDGDEYCDADVSLFAIYPYTYNTNPYVHDKCVVLGADIREMNWDNSSDGHYIIIRNSKGHIKLCESAEEFEAWRKRELEPIEKKCKYLNSLKSKVRTDGTIPFFVVDNDLIKENDTEVSVFPTSNL